MRGKALVVAWLVALGLAAGATVLVLTSDHDDNKAATIALALTAGLTFVGSGLLSLWRRPENRTGYLLAAVGYLWFLGAPRVAPPPRGRGPGRARRPGRARARRVS